MTRLPPRVLRRLARRWGQDLPFVMDPGLARKGKLPKAVGGLASKTPPRRLRPPEIDGLLQTLCAAQRHCVPGFDLLAVLEKLTTAQLEALATGGLADLDPQVANVLIADARFVADCVSRVAPVDPGAPDPAKLGAVQAWVGEVTAEAAKTGAGSCRTATPRIEQIFPVPGLVVAVTTGDDGVADQFAFVNVRRDNVPKDITPGDRAAYGCAHLEASYLPPAPIPTCRNGVDENGADCGTVVGGPCADLRQALPKPALWHPTAHPNGDWSPFTYCTEDEQGRPLVCQRELFPGAGQNWGGVCRRCGLPGDDLSTNYTMQGCPVAAGDDPFECPAGYAAGADGRCWRTPSGPPQWECEADCQAVYGPTGYCFHAGAWRDWWSDNDPDVDAAMTAALQSGAYYPESICAEWACDRDGAACAAAGQACSNDSCVAECTTDGNCGPTTGFPLRYPAGFVCTLAGTCRLP